MTAQLPSLERQREEFARAPFLAMPCRRSSSPSTPPARRPRRLPALPDYA